ncbi:ABC transporter ATP-binding protein NatA [Nymphon striatum]|nr:ABC transporter ATP-binding protein NatA [Nymphon striatum]
MASFSGDTPVRRPHEPVVEVPADHSRAIVRRGVEQGGCSPRCSEDRPTLLGWSRSHLQCRPRRSPRLCEYDEPSPMSYAVDLEVRRVKRLGYEPLRSRLPVTPAKEELGIAVGDFDTDLCVVGTVWVSDVHRDGAVFNNAVLGKEIVDDSLGRSGVACGIQLDRHDVEARATQLLDVLGLNEAANELVADYSTGMRKKVALAAALLHSPSVLLLDEPFESVDPVSSKIIVDVLQHYRASGGTIVFSSHVMDTVERLCDHVAIVSAGKVERNGPIETLTDGGTTRLEDVFIDAVGASAEEAGDSLSWLARFQGDQAAGDTLILLTTVDGPGLGLRSCSHWWCRRDHRPHALGASAATSGGTICGAAVGGAYRNRPTRRGHGTDCWVDTGPHQSRDLFACRAGGSCGRGLPHVDLPSPVTEQSSRIRVRHDLRHRFCHGANCAAGRRKQRRGCLWHSSRHVGQPWSVNERARIRCRLVVDGSTHAGPRAGQPDRPPAHRTAKPAPAHVAVGFGRGRVDRRVEARALGFAARGCGRGQCAHVRHRHFGGVTRGVTGLGQPIRQPPGKRIPWTPAGRDRHCWHDLHRCAVHADLHRGVPGDRRMVGVAHAAGRTGLCKRRVRPGRPVGRALPAWP